MAEVDLTSGLREELRAAISDAYYDARNNGGTMTTAANDAADRVMETLSRPSSTRSTTHRDDDPGRSAHWHLAKTASGQYVVRLIGGNGETVMVTETHPDKRDALHALTVVDEAQDLPVLDDHGDPVEEPGSAS